MMVKELGISCCPIRSVDVRVAICTQSALSKVIDVDIDFNRTQRVVILATVIWFWKVSRVSTLKIWS